MVGAPLRRSRRRSRRMLRLDCQVVRERDFRLVADRIQNLSSNGLLAGPADPVLTGERLIVSFRLPGHGWIDSEATVSRVVHGRRAGETSRALGIEFEGLDGPSRRALKRRLDWAPTPPGRRRRLGIPSQAAALNAS